MSTPPTRTKRRTAPVTVAPPRSDPPAPPPSTLSAPLLLDFYPLQTETQTRISTFFARLREKRLTTTRCRRDGVLLWPPRAVCPRCHTEELDWVDLPTSGRLYAFSAVLAGAPLGMEADVPFVVGLVDLDGAPLRLFGRIVGVRWEDCRIGDRVTFESFELPDGRVFYRFRHVPEAVSSGRDRSL